MADEGAGPDVPKIEKLNKSNYVLWKFNMLNWIRGKGWERYLTGDVNPEEANFNRIDSRVKAAIGFTLDEQHLASVVHCDTSGQMWAAIVNANERNTQTSKMLAAHEYHGYKFRPGMSCSEYLAGLNIIRAKMQALGKAVDDTDAISKTLHDLPREYDNFSSNWKLIASENEELQTMAKFEGHLLSEEQTLRTKHSHKSGHQASGDAFKTHPKKKKEKKNIECYSCHKKGHYSSECRSKPSGAAGGSGHSGQKFQKKQQKPKGLMTRVQADGSGSWISDSGASFHMTHDRSVFLTYKTLKSPMTIGTAAAGGSIEAVGIGNVMCRVSNGKGWQEMVLHDVRHVPGLDNTSLLSESLTSKRGYVFAHDDKHIWVRDKDTEEVVLVGDARPDGLFALRLKPIKQQSATVASAPSLKVWHQRLGHTGRQKILHMMRKDAAVGLDVGDTSADFECSSCTEGRMTRLPCPERTNRTTKPGERLSADLADGKSLSLGGARYFMLIKDEATAFRAVYFLKTKDEAADHIRNYVLKVEKQTNNGVKFFRTDGGGEFVNEKLKNFFASRGGEGIHSAKRN